MSAISSTARRLPTALSRPRPTIPDRTSPSTAMSMSTFATDAVPDSVLPSSRPEVGL